MSTRFNKKNYSRETISRYSIIGSYFIHQIYNTVYAKAKKEWHNNRNKESLTFLYEKYIDNYSLLMKKDREFRKKEFDGLFKYYIHHTGYRSWTFTVFLNEITKEFFIVESENALTTPQKHEIFTRTITNSLQSFISKLKNTYLGMIVDEHNNRENIKTLQEEFIDCLIYRREEWSDKIDNSGRSQYVPKSIVESISTERQSLEIKLNEVINNKQVKENEYDEKTKQLTVACEKLKSLALLSYTEVSKLKDIDGYNKILQSKYIEEINSLKNQLNDNKQSQESNVKFNSQLQVENISQKKKLETMLIQKEKKTTEWNKLTIDNKYLTEENIKLRIQIKSEHDKISYMSAEHSKIIANHQFVEPHRINRSNQISPYMEISSSIQQSDTKKKSNNVSLGTEMDPSMPPVSEVINDTDDRINIMNKSNDNIKFNSTSVDDLFT